MIKLHTYKYKVPNNKKKTFQGKNPEYTKLREKILIYETLVFQIFKSVNVEKRSFPCQINQEKIFLNLNVLNCILILSMKNTENMKFQIFLAILFRNY